MLHQATTITPEKKQKKDLNCHIITGQPFGEKPAELTGQGQVGGGGSHMDIAYFRVCRPI